MNLPDNTIPKEIPLPARAQNLKGRKFGRIMPLHPSRHVYLVGVYWWCQCDCGNQFEILGASLTTRRGPSRSCGCVRTEKLITRATKHGLCKSPEYRAWEGMKDRCLNKNAAFYHCYGGRGITVCVEWIRSFEAFYRDMGPRPGKGYSLDRINVDGNYEPKNCRWATVKQQARNKRTTRFLTIEGNSKPLDDWAELAGLPASTIRNRIDRNNWDAIDAVTMPPAATTERFLMFQGETLSLTAWSEKTGIRYATLYQRLRFGWTASKILTWPVRKPRKPKV